jgi:hypothetical protein
MTDFNHAIGISLSCLRMVWYAHDFRNFRLEFFFGNIRDQDIIIFRIRASNIVNVNEFITMSSLLLTGMRREESSDSTVTRRSRERGLRGIDISSRDLCH